MMHSSSTYKKDDGILQCLNLEEKTLIKISDPKPRSYRFPHFRKRNPKTCQELLKLSMLSLINFCRVGLGMTTAIASVTNDSLYNEIKAKSDEMPEMQREQDNDMLGVPKQNQNLPPPVHRLSEYHNGGFRTVPAYWPNRFSRSDIYNGIIVDNEQRDVFNVRPKRQNAEECQENKTDEIQGIPKPKDNDSKPFWGIMDIITDTKLSFFGRIFGNDVSSTTEDPATLNTLGQVRDTSFFQVVKSTLTKLQNKENPYLMIILGGELVDLSNKESQLVQSIKHVIENEMCNNTMIVVTGMCPNQEDDVTCNQKKSGDNEMNNDGQVVKMGEGVGENDEGPSIPVLAKGPNTDKLSQCTELYDVPITMKAILMDLQAPSDSTNPRKKRSIIRNIHKRKLFSKGRNIESSLTKWLASYLLITILFLL
ncbi:unnamed protein product [Brassicogethes aeneus]|uniref:Uncharacterized protein n=1 Tax=Brassicogethes aeneus TaxID=1431903 RepID=A0A9P0FHF0_BRAAE|nr:unnamed protein product [Brassicogethes aeneus]